MSFQKIKIRGKIMLDLYIIYENKFAKRVIEYLGKDPKKSQGIVGISKVPSGVEISSPSFIDEVENNLPENLPDSCDVILAIGVDMYIQALPILAEKTEAEAVIVPIENSSWYPLGILNQVKKQLEKKGVEVAYPRPFCSLNGNGREIIEEFIKDYEIGRPEVEVVVKNEEIRNVIVKTCAPCGSTNTVAENIEGAPASYDSSDILELEGKISEAHHSHPCTGDMMEDPILGETILHRAGYLVRDAVKKASGLDITPEKEEKKQGKISEKCEKLCGKCIEACKSGGTGILEMEEDEIIIPDYKKCVGCRSCVKKCPIDVTGKIVTKRDKFLIDEWEDARLSN